MEYITDYIDKYKDNDLLIVGGGRTIKDNESSINNFIYDNSITTIGINKLIPSIHLDYHLWTNKQRYHTNGKCISKKSKLMFGCNLGREVVKKHYRKKDYISINYTSIFSESIRESIGFNGEKISGFFRTAGTLGIMVAHIMGAKKIYVVGMDGYTLHGKKDLLSNHHHHHCYGSGYTDDANWEKCLVKDDQVNINLKELQDYGVEFKIITPTKFNDFYDDNIL